MRCFSGMKGRLLAAAAVAGGTLGFQSLATAQVTLPDTGVDVAEYIPLVIAALGAILGVALAGRFAFLIVRKGARMITGAFSKA